MSPSLKTLLFEETEKFSLEKLSQIQNISSPTNNDIGKDATSDEKIPTKIARIKEYLEKTGIERFGGGASRVVYDIGNGTVLKVAHNSTRIPENEKEIEVWECSKESIILAKIVKYDKADKMWIVMEKVKPFSSRKECFRLLQEKFGVDYSKKILFFETEDILIALTTLHAALKGKKNLVKWNVENNHVAKYVMENLWPDNINEWTRELLGLLYYCQINPVDFHFGNWGINGTGEMVLLDYGFR